MNAKSKIPNKPDLQNTIKDQLELLSTLDDGLLTKQYATDFARSKSGLVMEQIIAAGAKPAKWSKNMRHPMDVLAFEAFSPSDWSKPCAIQLYRIDGSEFPGIIGKGKTAMKARKAHQLRGSKDGLIVGDRGCGRGVVVWGSD